MSNQGYPPSERRVVSCAVCHSNKQSTYIREGQWTVVRCPCCGHLYTSPLFNQESYEEAYASSGDWIKQATPAALTGADYRYNVYVSELSSLSLRGNTILDIGCSKGRFLAMMRESGWDCYGAEPSRDAEYAKRALGADQIFSGFFDENSCFPECDVVTMFEVLEHVPEPEKLIRLIFDQLRPGGYFMGSIPNGDFIRLKMLPRRWLGIETMIVPLTMDPGNHINYFTPDGISKLMEDNKFEIKFVRNAPKDMNYFANHYSRHLKALWRVGANVVCGLTGRLIGSNLWFLCRKPE